MTKIISLFNQAGGQGKTTLTLNIGYHLAEHGHKVLLIDMDAQANLTSFIGKSSISEAQGKKQTTYDVILREKDMPITEDIYGMDFSPCDSRMYKLDLMIGKSNLKHPALRLKKAIDEKAYLYDYILIDCPPSLGMASVNALIASTHILIPIETAKKGLQGVDELFRTVSEAEKEAHIGIKYAGVVPMHFDKRNKTSPVFLKAIQRLEARMPVYPPVPIRVDFDYAWSHRQPVALFNGKCDVVPIFRKIVEGLETL